MAQHSGFFNALNVNGVFDRKYNANDYSDNLAVVISNGVLRSDGDDLKVVPSGMVLTVSVGRAWINGHYYLNDSPFTFAAVTAPIGGTRWDRVVLRLNKDVSAREVSLVYVQGTESNSPEKPSPIRSGNIYDLVLADVYVGTNASTLTVVDTRTNKNLCGWVYSTAGDNSFFTSLDNAFNTWFENARDTLSSVTLFKRYQWRTVIQTATNKVNFSIPQWDAETCFLEVYVNGVLDYEGDDYTLSGTILTFSGTLTGGTEVVVKVFKSIDGTGINSVADEITELQNTVADLASEQEYIYICNGIDDNVKLSEVAQTWLDGGTDYDSKIVRVYGSFVCSAPVGGSGSAGNPYKWISVGGTSAKNRKIVFDFSGCSQISVPITAGTYNIIFAGVDAHIIGANVTATQTESGTIIRMFSNDAKRVDAENCRFWITGYQDSLIACNGNFVNCRASVANLTANSYCFMPYALGLLKITGGEYYAYTGASSSKSAVVGQSNVSAASILYGVSAPTLSRSGFYQTNSLYQVAGGGMMNCTDLVSELPLSVVSGISNIRGTISMSKAGIL